MKQYSIGAIARLTGLSVHNLRVWEKRHNAVETSRSDSGRRIYDEQALERLRLLKGCVDNGFSIGSIAAQSDDDLRALLADFDDAPQHTTAPTQGLRAALVGNEAISLVDHVNGFPIELHTIDRYPTIDSLLSNNQSKAIDLLIAEQPSLSPAETQALANTLKQLSPRHTLIIYRYARQQDIAYLRSLNIQCMKSRIPREEVLELLQTMLETPQTEPIIQKNSNRVPERLFSDQALQKAAAMSTSIECECPHHLSELIKSVVSFEQYSLECESKDQEAYDLHHHIYERSAQARAILEDLLTSVLLQEGIDLSRVKH